ncbi:XdhC family protein [Erwinia sp. 9145]|uniref:XdhC family protein n=1 Tax=Erwinia sp. 9145 TaxID=1500895 RepID=UPI00068D9448|nr:XdhC family protein [Erwinia sp. 9145]
MSGLFAKAAELQRQNGAFALLHIVQSRGSTPRHSASMLVSEEGETVGTIGGGMMERLAIEQAAQALSEGRSQLFHARLARQGRDAVGSDCGGDMTVFIAVYPRRPALYLFGAGHVNRAVAQAAQPLGFSVVVADTWEKNLCDPALPADCRCIRGESYSRIIEELTLDAQGYAIIATNSQDSEVLKAIVTRPLAYLGLLASRRKAWRFRESLKNEQGLNDEALAHFHSPVGIDIAAETPEEIAISILGDIVRHYRQVNRQRSNDKINEQGGLELLTAVPQTTAV